MDTTASTMALALAALSLLGCASSDLPASPSFVFDLDGVPYVIVAVGPASEPANDLVQLDGSRVLLRGRDLDQDGTLDTLLVGAVPLAVADAIYRRGIEAARARGVAQSREPSRLFELADAGSRLVVWSQAEGGSGWHNRLVRYGPSGQPGPVYVDTDADGRLDDGAPDRAQSDYQRILEAGLREDRIERVDGRLRVRVQPTAA